MCGGQNPNATQPASSQKGLYLQKKLKSDTKMGASDQTSAHRAGKQKTQTGDRRAHGNGNKHAHNKHNDMTEEHMANEHQHKQKTRHET